MYHKMSEGGHDKRSRGWESSDDETYLQPRQQMVIAGHLVGPHDDKRK
jgi:hypothetical protein